MQKSSKLIFLSDACLLYHHISLYSDGAKLSLEIYQVLVDILRYVLHVNHDYSTSVLHDNRKKNSATEPIPNEETND